MAKLCALEFKNSKNMDAYNIMLAYILIYSNLMSVQFFSNYKLCKNCLPKSSLHMWMCYLALE